jgi:hypothetical protein
VALKRHGNCYSANHLESTGRGPDVYLAFTVILAAVLAMGCGETRDAAYEDIAQAVRDGAVQRGWVPTWLPKSSREIHLTYNLDTNASMLSLRYSKQENWVPPSQCSNIGRITLPPPPFSRNWWPGDIPPSRLATHRHAFLYCAQDNLYIAVLSNGGQAYIWR